MKTNPAFDIGLPAYTVHQLSLEDGPAIQALFERCLDFMLLVDGHPAGPNAGEETFQDVPPGNAPDDKLIFGIYSQQQGLVGLLDALRGYPDETTWWIGLFLLAPETRSQGIGQRSVDSFCEFAHANGAQAVMLGVVEQNIRAYQFWSRTGFEFVRETEPRQFGDKLQRVSVMRRSL